MRFTDVMQFISLNFPGISMQLEELLVKHLKFWVNGIEYAVTTEKCHGQKVWLVTSKNLPILCEDDEALRYLLVDVIEQAG